jgi:hypothetical protein
MKNKTKLILLFTILFVIIFFIFLNIDFIKASTVNFFKTKNIISVEKPFLKKINGNSFSFTFIQEVEFPKKTRTASVIVDNSNNYEIFTQDGKKFHKSSSSKIKLPSNFFLEKNGGIKSVFVIEDIYFALITLKTSECYYLSLIRLSDLKEILKSECIPDTTNIDFNGSGGAYLYNKGEILLSIGTPEVSSESIRQLAQDLNSIFGKIISIKMYDLLKKNTDIVNYKIFSYGHRNPQGLSFLNKYIFSSEHGPYGGDEINLLKKGNNYGWPLISYGTRYNNGKSFNFYHKNKKIAEPIYTFLPSVAPSALTRCPQNLINYYNKKNCLMSLTLREKSILIILLDNNFRVISVEKFFLDKRLRHFGLKNNSELYFDKDNNFYFSADNDGFYKGSFGDFR